MSNRLPPLPRFMNNELALIIEKQGGLFWLEGEHQTSTIRLFEVLTRRFNCHVENATASLYLIRPREISYGILNSSSLNAIAYASDLENTPPFDFVGINIGSIFTLNDVFSRILAHPQTFPEVGSPEKENSINKEIPFLSPDVFKDKFSTIYPNCPIRGLFAFLLAQMALDFLFFHEITHLRFGHLEYLKNELSFDFWSEAFGSTLETRRNKILQTLEWDADCGAIVLTLINAFHTRSLTSQIPLNQPHSDAIETMRKAFESPESTVKLVAYSAYILFRIFDKPEWNPKYHDELSHPFQPLRMFNVLGILNQIFIDRGHEYQYTSEEFLSISDQIMLDAEIACGLIRGDSPDPRAIMSVMASRERSSYFSGLSDIWNEIKPELEKYKRGGKLAD